MNYYNYFLALEQKFIDIARFVEPDRNNYATFSTEISLCFLAACSEFEVVSKEICNIVAPGSLGPRPNIDNIRNVLIANIPDMASEAITLYGYAITIRPLSDWTLTPSNNPPWWRSYNNVKHNRGIHYNQGSLENLINALAALHIACFYLTWKTECPQNPMQTARLHLSAFPKIFRLDNVTYTSVAFTDEVFDS